VSCHVPASSVRWMRGGGKKGGQAGSHPVAVVSLGKSLRSPSAPVNAGGLSVVVVVVVVMVVLVAVPVVVVVLLASETQVVSSS